MYLARLERVRHARHAMARAPARARSPHRRRSRAEADHVQAPRAREPGTGATQHEGGVSFVPARGARPAVPRATNPTTTLLSCPQLRQDLADARRRAAVAANAEAQAGIVVAMHRERQAEAASLRRELLVRERPALGLYGIGFGREANLEGRSSRVRKKSLV